MRKLSKAHKLGFPTRTLEVPEWDVEVCIRAMTAKEKIDLGRQSDRLQAIDDNDALGQADVSLELYAGVCAKCIVDPDTKERLYVTDNDVAALSAQDPAGLMRVGQAILDLSGLDGGAAEDVAKNSEPVQSAALPSD